MCPTNVWHDKAKHKNAISECEMTAVGFEPTPLRTGALSQRLRPLGQTVSINTAKRHSHYTTRIPTRVAMDTLGIEPRAFRMQSGCDTTTPCARLLI